MDCNEEVVFEAVLRGELEVDEEGRVWRLGNRRGSGKFGVVRFIPCERRRAENDYGRYLQVRVMVDGERVTTQASRLVWRALRGPIPGGLTVNHKDGRKKENRPSNLELATMVEQIQHARDVLGHQYGLASRVEPVVIAAIVERRARGETRAAVAAALNISVATVAKFTRRSACTS